jgi:hypothetical protein
MEDIKLEPFRDTFQGIHSGDDRQIFQRLFKAHRRYSDGSPANQELYQKILALHPKWKE